MPSPVRSTTGSARPAERRYGDLVAAPLRPSRMRLLRWGAAPVSQVVGSVRGELVPPCDFPLGLHRETAGCGMVAITFVHFPTRAVRDRCAAGAYLTRVRCRRVAAAAVGCFSRYGPETRAGPVVAGRGR
ncbi:hypothetical protein GCM10010515_00910 [Streptomyces fructofermentans]|uniref:Uncharacterized protein n=1 Tax=Streptomyces fructofermentans TaxID=152141 RepID=A0A918N590_9ACTN|nr:hypothetical protein GCM10010515_00910 [Streptomyces fructofermentans]